MQDYARQYLEMHELAADYMVGSGNAPEQILQTVQERACDALLMGSYSYSPLMESMRGGTAVNRLLRGAPCRRWCAAKRSKLRKSPQTSEVSFSLNSLCKNHAPLRCF